jgi:hypothetical protein
VVEWLVGSSLGTMVDVYALNKHLLNILKENKRKDSSTHKHTHTDFPLCHTFQYIQRCL